MFNQDNWPAVFEILEQAAPVYRISPQKQWQSPMVRVWLIILSIQGLDCIARDDRGVKRRMKPHIAQGPHGDSGEFPLGKYHYTIISETGALLEFLHFVESGFRDAAQMVVVSASKLVAKVAVTMDAQSESMRVFGKQAHCFTPVESPVKRDECYFRKKVLSLHPVQQVRVIEAAIC